MGGGRSLALADKQDLEDGVYTVRGQQIMLDPVLAQIYGYATKRFGERVGNSIEKLDGDFRFQLAREEAVEILRSKKSTSRWGGSRYLPYAVAEQGI